MLRERLTFAVPPDGESDLDAEVGGGGLGLKEAGWSGCVGGDVIMVCRKDLLD